MVLSRTNNCVLTTYKLHNLVEVIAHKKTGYQFVFHKISKVAMPFVN